VNEFLTKKGIPVVPLPPYMPDLSLCDFFFFQKIPIPIKRWNFGSVDNIQMIMTEQLRALSHEDFQHCYWGWEQRLRQCGFPRQLL